MNSFLSSCGSCSGRRSRRWLPHPPHSLLAHGTPLAHSRFAIRGRPQGSLFPAGICNLFALSIPEVHAVPGHIREARLFRRVGDREHLAPTVSLPSPFLTGVEEPGSRGRGGKAQVLCYQPGGNRPSGQQVLQAARSRRALWLWACLMPEKPRARGWSAGSSHAKMTPKGHLLGRRPAAMGSRSETWF